jgi:sulfatase-like protein
LLDGGSGRFLTLDAMLAGVRRAPRAADPVDRPMSPEGDEVGVRGEVQHRMRLSSGDRWAATEQAGVQDPTLRRRRAKGAGMPTDKPNVLLILADDVGWFDGGAYRRGLMGTRTPNIDRVAAEGAMMTDAYAQASCTAGRAAFITGLQTPADARTGAARCRRAVTDTCRRR